MCYGRPLFSFHLLHSPLILLTTFNYIPLPESPVEVVVHATMNGSRFAPRDADELRSSEIVYESAAPSARPSAPPAASTYLVYEPSNIDDVKIVKRKLVKLLPST